MYKAFLSYAQLKEYLDILTANGLLEYQKSEGTYRTTAKGKKFLELYNDMGQLITIKKSKSAHTTKSTS
jgi:predicted transcriptional regulator